MSAVCRIIHLHGGPSDGLCLAWNELMGDTCVSVASTTVAFPEYDYIYVPRVAGAVRARHGQAVRPSSSTRSFWQQLWTSCQAWLLTPSSYPLDTRHLQIPVRKPESLTQNK